MLKIHYLKTTPICQYSYFALVIKKDKSLFSDFYKCLTRKLNKSSSPFLNNYLQCVTWFVLIRIICYLFHSSNKNLINHFHDCFTKKYLITFSRYFTKRCYLICQSNTLELSKVPIKAIRQVHSWDDNSNYFGFILRNISTWLATLSWYFLLNGRFFHFPLQMLFDHAHISIADLPSKSWYVDLMRPMEFFISLIITLFDLLSWHLQAILHSY